MGKLKVQGTAQFELAFPAVEIQLLPQFFALKDCILISASAGFIYKATLSLGLSSHSAFLRHTVVSHTSSGLGI